MGNFVNDNSLKMDVAVNAPPVRPAAARAGRSPPWPRKFLETYHPGESVFRTGAAAKSIWEVVAGAVAFTHVSGDGRRIVVGFAFQSELIGVSQAGHFIHDAEALTATKLVRVPVGDLAQFSRRDHRLTARVDTMASLLTSSLIMQVALLMRRNADSRIAAFLVSVAHRLPAGDEEGSLVLPMTREDIGNFVGMTAESVCRSLTNLQKTGVLAFENARLFRVKDFPRLLRLAVGDEAGPGPP